MQRRGLIPALLLCSLLGSTADPANGAAAAGQKSSITRPVDRYLMHYGIWTPAAVALAKTHQMVVLHPAGGNVTRQLVADLQGGTNPADPSKRVLVLAYLSVGEDDRMLGLTPAQMRADARFRGDGTGPRIDPRGGPSANGKSLAGIAPLGLPSTGGTGFASWYLDDNSVHAYGVGDGIPDRNAAFGGCFVNAGDPKWFDVVQNMTLDGVDRSSGLREILTTTYGRGLGCDGVFMDTIDTPMPNSWTSASSPNPSKFEWTAPGFLEFVRKARSAHPDRLIMQNRGLFFLNPELPHYKYSTRPYIDSLLFESYRLNSSSSAAENPHPVYYPGNRYGVTPKLMAEANRPDGFRVFSLGYAAGSVSPSTLTGQSSIGYDSLLEDIRVTQELAGFRHFITTPDLDLPNSFVRDHSSMSDTTPPAWTSTWNPSHSSAPTPRIGIRQAVALAGGLTVRWDVALDKHPVGYALYYQTQPFNFTANPTLSGSTRVVLTPSMGAGYADAYGSTCYPYQATITGLTPGRTYHLVIRAFDKSPAANEERNQVVLTGVPAGGSAPPPPPASYDLARWRASNGVADLTYRFQYSGAWTWRRVWIDRDRNAGTGYYSSRTDVGAEYFIENGILYRYTGSGSSWSWAAVSPNPVTQATGTVDGMISVQWTLPQASINATSRDVDLVFQIEKTGAWASSTVYRHVYTSSSSSAPFYDSHAENDDAKIYYHTRIRPSFAFRQIFLDEDENAATGYAIGGIGAGYLIENGTLYRYGGSGWSWTTIGDAHATVNGDSYAWWIRRADVGETRLPERSRLVFRGHGGPASATSPVYVHAFSD